MSKRIDDLREQVSRLCGETDVPEPAEFLASLMAGKDPRPRSSYIKSFINSIVRDNGGDKYESPSPEDWAELVDHVNDSGLYESESVSLETSEKAATKLMDFLHAKLKSVEVSGELSHNHKLTPLSDEEAERFAAIWEAKFK